MKVKGKRLPLGWLIVLCIAGIVIIGTLLVVFLGDKSWFNALAYLVAASAIAGGSCVAYHHLRTIQGTERATVLTSLDNCWYGSLAVARSEFHKFKNSLVNSKDSTSAQQEIIDKLKTMREDDPDTYRNLFNMLDFYETLGYFSRVKYILTKDVIQVYGPNIRDYDEIFHEYILGFQDAEKDTSIYENFLWLTDKLEEQYN
ncbi:hypothetical protein ACFLVS_05835 [Chloroflexota bacterium]